MKALVLFLLIFSLPVIAEDPKSYIENFDNKIYSLKAKGIKEFVVDITSSKLTKQLNDQLLFGKIDEVIFRTYWTVNPQRIAIEIIGMPEGFKEVKEELKLSVMSIMENLIPVGVQSKFSGYKITAGKNPKEFLAQDTSGIAAIPSYVLKFDEKDKLEKILGMKPIGTFEVDLKYSKEVFSDGKWVLRSQVTKMSEQGQNFTSTKELTYSDSKGISVLTRVSIKTGQQWNNPESRPMEVEENIDFQNYKIDSGEALKYFLSESPKR